jgi:hypothetical protein
VGSGKLAATVGAVASTPARKGAIVG